MAEFGSSVYQNEFLPDGGTDVNAIVTIDCVGAGSAGQTGSGAAGEVIIVDTSGSMGEVNIRAAQQAAAAAIDQVQAEVLGQRAHDAAPTQTIHGGTVHHDQGWAMSAAFVGD